MTRSPTAGIIFVAVAASLLAMATAQPRRRPGPPVLPPPNRPPIVAPLIGLAAFPDPPGGAEAASKLPPVPATQPPTTSGRCNVIFRQLDGRCTTSFSVLLGAKDRAQFSYGLTRSARVPTGGRRSTLPSARLISNVVFTQAGDVFSRRNLNEMVTFMGQFLDHSVIGTPVDEDSRFDIPVPRTDPLFANVSRGRLEFSRSKRTPDSRGRERPLNELSSAIDLTTVYGPDKDRLRKLRTLWRGLMKTSKGDLLPLNTARLDNAPSKSSRFFVAGDRRVNENPALTALHVLFLREHNRLARELFKTFKFWDDETLFEVAKLINTAQYQKIIFEEFFPAMTGRQLPRYRGYKKVDPTVSDVFGAAAFRIGHTMISNQVSRRGPGNRRMSPIRFQDMFFRRPSVLDDGIEPFIRGAIFERSQEVDTKVVTALRNFLFTNVREEVGIDLMALNIQRGRDHAIPTYNELRTLFGRKKARRYRDITRNRAVQTALSSAYDRIDDIDAIVGLFAEDHVSGASMGPTMLEIWKREFTRLRDGDRFAYIREESYPLEILTRFPPLRRILRGRDTFKKLILRNTRIRSSDVRGSVWKAKRRSRTGSSGRAPTNRGGGNRGRQPRGGTNSGGGNRGRQPRGGTNSGGGNRGQQPYY